jgi:hypothetical protein
VRVVWVSFAPLDKQAGNLTSKLASARYRMLIPAAAMKDCDCKVIHLAAGANRRTLMERFRGADAVVLGKLLGGEHEAALAMGLIAQLKEAGIAVLADYSDDHFSSPLRGEAYRALANAVDRIVASTPALAEVIAAHSPTPVSIVTDPVEGAKGEPRVPGPPPHRLLWFGHPSNIDTLQYGLPQLQGLPVSLTLISAPGSGAEQLGARFIPWSAQAVFAELRECDAVIIPSNPHDPRKAVKSPNRFTESTWAGRFVLAHPLPAYQELAEFGWVGEDLGEGLRWLAANGEAARQRIAGGQAAIAERFSPRAVAVAWKEAIERTIRR